MVNDARIVLTPVVSSHCCDHSDSGRPDASSRAARKSVSSVLPQAWRAK